MVDSFVQSYSCNLNKSGFPPFKGDAEALPVPIFFREGGGFIRNNTRDENVDAPFVIFVSYP